MGRRSPLSQSHLGASSGSGEGRVFQEPSPSPLASPASSQCPPGDLRDLCQGSLRGHCAFPSLIPQNLLCAQKYGVPLLCLSSLVSPRSSRAGKSSPTCAWRRWGPYVRDHLAATRCFLSHQPQHCDYHLIHPKGNSVSLVPGLSQAALALQKTATSTYVHLGTL